MNKTASIFYKTESTATLIVALLMLLNVVLIIIQKGGQMGWGGIVILLNIVVATLGLLFWLWRNFLKNYPPENRMAHAFLFLLNRIPLYFLLGVGFAMNYDIPSTFKRTQNYREQLKQQRFENRFLCKYIHGEAPIENGIWVFDYQPVYRHTRGTDELRFEVHCKDGKLHGMAKEEHLNRGLWIENYYTNGHLDSNAVFRREFRQEGRDTVIKIGINNSHYTDLKHICPK